jgi:6-phosphogluconolactonase (cycloisomerase 2 family)
VSVFPLGADGVPTGERTLVGHNGHPHMVVPDGDSFLIVDLGREAVLDATMAPLARLPGSGPRHLERDARGLTHVLGENDATVISFDSAWREIGRVPATTASHAYPSEIVISGDGRFAYVANRGPDTIAMFTLAGGPARFASEVSSGGAWPRHLAIVDDFLYVANEHSHTVVTFRLDPVTGMPSPTGAVLFTPSPTCVLPALLPR